MSCKMARWKMAWAADGDWVALIDCDEVVYQSHSISPERLLELLGVDYDDLGEYDLSVGGRFPENLGDWDKLPKT